MTEPSLALQVLIRSRLIADPAVTAIVPANNIFDSNSRPERFPRIVIGDGFANYGDDFEAFHDKTFLDLHLWTESPSLASVKEIAGAVRSALKAKPWPVAGFLCSHLMPSTFRTMRDPQGYSHGVLTVEAILQERET